MNTLSTFQASSPSSRKSFKIYRMAKKIWNDQGFQILIKRHIKALKSIDSQEFYIPLSNEAKTDQLQRKRLKYLDKIIRHAKATSSLRITIQAPDPSHINYLIPSFKHLSSLKTFRVSFISKAFMTPKACQNLTRSLRNLKQLVNLDCSLYNGLKDHHKALQSLRYISTLRHLAVLPISFQGIRDLKDHFCKWFSCHLVRITSLASLTLELSHCEGSTQAGLLDIWKSVGKLPTLRTLNLQARGFKVLDSNMLIQLFQNLGCPPHFKQLILNLSGCKLLKNNGQDPLVTGLALLNPGSLDKISIEFSDDFLDSDLSELFITLQRFSSLTHLSLNLNQLKKITPHGFSNLPQTTKFLPSLIHFHIRLNPKIDANSLLHGLCLSLQNLPNLTSLKIEVWHNHIVKNTTVQELSSHLSKLHKLTHLYLAFANCSNLRSVVIEDLAVALKELNSLKSLYLNYQYNSLTNPAFNGLVSSLGYLKDLWSLELHFNYSLNLDKDCFEVLARSLQQLLLLDTIILGVRSEGQQKIIKKYKELIRALGGIERLRNIMLGFEEFREEDIDEEISQKLFKNEKQHFDIYL